jgi:hypothetical protein
MLPAPTDSFKLDRDIEGICGRIYKEKQYGMTKSMPCQPSSLHKLIVCKIVDV